MMIYGLRDSRDPDQRIRYVGQTVRTGPRRLAEHRRDAATGTAIVYKWMRRCGPQNIEIVVLEDVPDGADLDAAEARWITAMRTHNPWLLNMWKPYVAAPSLTR